jgi:hypothetical protein
MRLEGGTIRRTCLACGASADKRITPPELDAHDLRLAQPCGQTAGVNYLTVGELRKAMPELRKRLWFWKPETRGFLVETVSGGAAFCSLEGDYLNQSEHIHGEAPAA